MKKLPTIILLLLISLTVLSQTEGFKYQAIVRDAAGNANANASVNMEISIIQGSADGSIIYSETHACTSNSFGLVNLVIGSVNFQSFALIDWRDGPFFIKISVDGIDFGTSQLLSVPFAMHAKTAESYTELDPEFNQSASKAITEIDIENWNNKPDSLIETDPVFMASPLRDITIVDINSWTNKLDAAAESDPVFASSIAKGINGYDTAYWNSKLDEFVELDPTFMEHPASGITEEDITKWKALFVWYTTNANNYLSKNSVAGSITAADTALWNCNSSRGPSVTELNDLSDAINNGSIFIGTDAGIVDDASDNRNTSVGNNTLKANTSGDFNTAVGANAMMKNTVGASNTAIGPNTLINNINGESNTAIGYDVLALNTSGNQNTGIGRSAMHYNTTGSKNTSIGFYSNILNGTGSSNTIIGYEAGRGTTNHNKSGNVFLGYQAGYSEHGSNKLYIENTNSTSPLIYGDFVADLIRVNGTLDINNAYQLPTVDGADGQLLTTNGSGTLSWANASSVGITYKQNGDNFSGSLLIGHNTTGVLDNANNNTGVGLEVLQSITSGDNNVANGYRALYSNTTGSHNLANGYYALYRNTTGNYNTANGYHALYQNKTGSNNSADGSLALFSNISGDNNTALGSHSGYYALGSNNVFLGNNAGHAETGSNKLYIDNSNTNTPLIYGEFEKDSLRVNGTLDIKETIRIEGGNPGAGKILTSDANGLASWETLSSGIQSISRSGLTVTLSNGGGTYTDSVNTYLAGSGLSLSNNSFSVSDLDADKITSGTFSVNRIPLLDASQISTGEINSARLPDASTTQAGIIRIATQIEVNDGTLNNASVTPATLAGEMNTKADKTYVDSKLVLKSDKTYVDSELGLKSDKAYVDTELALKADKIYVDTELGVKSDKTYVDSEIGDLKNTIIATASTLTVETGKQYMYTGTSDLTVTIPDPADHAGESIKLYCANRGHAIKFSLSTSIKLKCALFEAVEYSDPNKLFYTPSSPVVTLISDGSIWYAFNLYDSAS